METVAAAASRETKPRSVEIEMSQVKSVLGYVLELWKHVLRVEHGLEYVFEVTVYDDSDEGDWVGSKGKNAIEVIHLTSSHYHVPYTWVRIGRTDNLMLTFDYTTASGLSGSSLLPVSPFR